MTTSLHTVPAAVASAFEAVEADAMDCLQVNLAVLADSYHGPGTSLRMGARLTFEPRVAADGLPTIEPRTDHHVTRSSDQAGVDLSDMARQSRWPDDATGRIRYCVSDAYELPWLPYFGREHMDHGFLIVGDGTAKPGVTVVDAYRNDTSHGAATPVHTRLIGRQAEHILTSARCRVATPTPRDLPPASPRAVLRANADHLNRPAAAETIRQYVTAYREHPDQVRAMNQLTLETWLLARSRRLHARWLGAALGGHRARQTDEHAARCSEVSAKTYFASRRVRNGRAAPAIHDLLQELLTAEAAMTVDLDLR